MSSGDPFELYSGSTSVRLEWWYPPRNASAFVIEQKSAGTDFQDVLRVEGTAVRADVPMPEEGPFGAIGFRVRAEPGAVRSNIVSYHRSVPSPRVSAYFTGTGFEVEFSAFFGKVDVIKLSRRAVRPNAATGAWQELASGKRGENRYFDADLSAYVDNARYQYQAVSWIGPVSSEPVLAESDPAGLLPPAITSAQGDESGVHVVIRVSSAQGNTVRLQRRELSDSGAPTNVMDFASPRAGAELSFDDRGVAAGLYEYTCFALADPFPGAEGRLWVAVPPTGASASILDLPPAFAAARGPSGAFTLLADSRPQLSRILLLPGGGEAYARQELDELAYLGFDAESHPHAIHPGGTTSAGRTLIHVTHGGEFWDGEFAATMAAGSDPRATSALDGTLMAAWTESGTVKLVRRVKTYTWQVETVPLSARSISLLAGDESGAEHLLFTDAAGVLSHAWREAGSWRTEPVPASAGAVSRSSEFLFAGGGRVTLLERIGDAGGYRLSIRERSASGWEEADPLPYESNLLFSRLPRYHAASSRDGKRVAVSTLEGPVVLREAGSTRVLSWPRLGEAIAAVGFNGDGSVWRLDDIVDPFTADSTPRRPGSLVLLEERR